MWNSAAEFFAMGGHALFVWSSFGVCALVLILEPLSVRLRQKNIIKRLRKEVLAMKFDQKDAK